MTNNWTTSGVSRTAANGLLAAAILAQTALATEDEALNVGRIIQTRSESPTAISQYASLLTGKYPIADFNFAQEFAEAYQGYARSQRALEPDIAAALAADLWNLYER